jgi:hypothetical protein
MATKTAPELRQSLTSYIDKFGTFREGTQLHADHPAVKARPASWAPVGLSDDELHEARFTLRRAQEAKSPTPDQAPGGITPGPIPPERRRVAVKDSVIGGAFLAAGDVLDANSATVKRNPTLFAKG